MALKKSNFIFLLLAIVFYYLLAFFGFLLLKQFGILYYGNKIHIYAIPMMLLISAYVYFLNERKIFRGEDFRPKKEHFGLFLIPYITVAVVVATLIEAIITQRSLLDVVCMAFLTFLIGISEEGMFRLFLLKNCGSSLKNRIALLFFSAITFSALHMMNIGGGLSFEAALTQSIAAFPFGLVAGFLFLQTGNISSLVFWHMFIDFNLFITQLGVFLSATILGFIVDIVMIAVFLRCIIHIFVGYVRSFTAN